MIKAIFFDIDGTLLSHTTYSVPESTKEALRLLKEKGILTFVATGRHLSEMRDLPIQDLEFDACITLNGQYCFNKDGMIYGLPIEQTDINNIINYVDTNHMPCIFVEDELMYINFNNEVVEKVQKAISTPLPELGDIHRGYTHPIYQVIPYDTNDERLKEIKELMPHCKETQWNPQAVDIIPATGGKQNGIHEVLKYYSIDQSETMSFGDGKNDIDMFEYTKISVAMGNAEDDVKKAADYVTDDIDEDGLYNALKHFEII